MKKLFLILSFFILYSVELFSQDIKILGYDEEHIGVLKENKIKIYKYENTGGWQEMESMEFNLPAGCQDAFAIFGSWNRFFTGIVIENRLKIYFFDDDNWIESTESDTGIRSTLNLPKNYEKIFTIQLGYPVFAVVANDKIKIIEVIDGVWKENPKWEFRIPDGYLDVIEGSNDYNHGGFGVVFNDRIQFYLTVSETFEWYEVDEIRFNLPSRNQKVVGLGYNFFGIVEGSKIII